MNNLYQILFVALDIFNTYCIFRLIHSFHINNVKNNRIEICGYVAYHLLITYISMVIKVPLITMISSFILLFLVSFVYYSPLITRIVAIIITQFSFTILEVILGLLTNANMNETITLQSDIFLQTFFCRGVQFILTLMFINMNKMENCNKLFKKIINWILILISAFTLIYILIKLHRNELSINQVGNVVLLLLFAIVVIIPLYYYYIINIKEQNKKEKLIQQNKYYIHQYEQLQTHTENIKKLEHDLNNHISTIKLMLGDNKEDVIEYLDNISNTQEIQEDDSYIHTGNLSIDSILSMKFKEIQEKGIELKQRILIPINLNVNDYDISCILNGLIDQAIHNIEQTEDKGKRKMRLKLRFDRDRLFIWLTYPHIQNASTDYAIKEEVKAAVRNYSGDIRCEMNQGICEISILMFIPRIKD